MPSGGRGLDSILQRSDSKDPATTCRGVNKNGARCRRTIGNVSRNSGTSPHGELLSLLYCHQHKDQAGEARENLPTIAMSNVSRKKNSKESLVERLGIPNRDSKKRRNGRQMESPRRSGFLGSCCFASTDRTQPGLPIRPAPNRPRPEKYTVPSPKIAEKEPAPSLPANVRVSNGAIIIEKRPESAIEPRLMESLDPYHSSPDGLMLQPPSNIPHNRRNSNQTHRPSVGRNPSSQTQTLMRLIPQSLSPETVAALLAELVKPFSAADKAGYIYMYCLTDRNKGSVPSPDMASSLLDSPLSTATKYNRRHSDAMRACAIDDTDSVQKGANGRVFLLKIGRSNDVQRRMREWQYKCGFQPSVVRQYPYIRSGDASSTIPPRMQRGNSEPPPNTAGTVPRASRVERLIHIELSGYRKSRWCEKCSESHNEWFLCNDITAVSHVDGVIRKWVGWSIENSQ